MQHSKPFSQAAVFCCRGVLLQLFVLTIIYCADTLVELMCFKTLHMTAAGLPGMACHDTALVWSNKRQLSCAMKPVHTGGYLLVDGDHGCGPVNKLC